MVVRAPGRRPEMHTMYRPLEDARRDPGCSAMFKYPPALGNQLNKLLGKAFNALHGFNQYISGYVLRSLNHLNFQYFLRF